MKNRLRAALLGALLLAPSAAFAAAPAYDIQTGDDLKARDARDMNRAHAPLKPAEDAVLLDNMTLDMLRQAVAIVDCRAITEASGRINPQTAADIAATGVDLISVGWLTHSAPVLDIGLDFVSEA